MTGATRTWLVKLIGHGNLYGALVLVLLTLPAGFKGNPAAALVGLAFGGIMLLCSAAVARRSAELHLLGILGNVVVLLVCLLGSAGSTFLATVAGINLAGLVLLFPRTAPVRQPDSNA